MVIQLEWWQWILPAVVACVVLGLHHYLDDISVYVKYRGCEWGNPLYRRTSPLYKLRRLFSGHYIGRSGSPIEYIKVRQLCGSRSPTT